ncbi:MAG TPA: hypothetical protein VIT44_17935 [Cyclobacteriaceae bacterium]
MKINRIILALKISFLLSIFAAATFYFQYAALKRAYAISCSQDEASEKSSGSLPLAEEEETENEKSASEEEQDDDRVFHRLEIISEQNSRSAIRLSTVHLLDFKEIHFEIVTPPPQA